MLGMAVGAVIENREAIANASAPVRNVASGAVHVVFATIWKSAVVQAAFIAIWVAIYVFTTLLGLSMVNVTANPMFLLSFGLFLSLLVPSVVFAREVYRAANTVKVKNAEQRVKAKQEREQAEAKYAEAVAAWEASQQSVPITQPMPQFH